MRNATDFFFFPPTFFQAVFSVHVWIHLILLRYEGLERGSDVHLQPHRQQSHTFAQPVHLHSEIVSEKH